MDFTTEPYLKGDIKQNDNSMKTDEMIKQDILEELIYEPGVHEAEIGVSVKDGIVSLSGEINRYSEKLKAEKAVKKVGGVKAIVNQIKVNIGTSYRRTDQDIADAALNALKWNSWIPEDKIRVKVETGFLTLEGIVNWEYIRNAAEKAVQNLNGVTGVANQIRISSNISMSKVHDRIRDAFQRNATIDADRINIQIDGHQVILTGSVESWAEKKQAKYAAWSAPGVTEVIDNLEVIQHEHAYS